MKKSLVLKGMVIVIIMMFVGAINISSVGIKKSNVISDIWDLSGREFINNELEREKNVEEKYVEQPHTDIPFVDFYALVNVNITFNGSVFCTILLNKSGSSSIWVIVATSLNNSYQNVTIKRLGRPPFNYSNVKNLQVLIYIFRGETDLEFGLNNGGSIKGFIFIILLVGIMD